MFINKLLKCLGLFLISIVFLTIILYLTAIVCLTFEIFNEYVLCCFLGILYSIIVLLSGIKLINKIRISFKFYLLFTTFLPALIFDVSYIFLRSSNRTVSIFDGNISEIMYYFTFMCFTFSVAAIVVAIIELLRFLTISRD